MLARYDSFRRYFSPAEGAYTSYAFRNPRTLLSPPARVQKDGDCIDCQSSHESSSPISAVVREWNDARREGDPESLAVTARNVLRTISDLGKAESYAASAIGKVSPEDAAIIAKLLADIAKHLPPSCVQEWKDALEICAIELSKPNPSKTFTGGHGSLTGCAKGMVSDECGGNAVSIEPKKRR